MPASFSDRILTRSRRHTRLILLCILGSVLPSAARPARAQVTTLFSDDFSSGTLAQWNNTGAASIANGQLVIPKSLDMIRANAGTGTWTDYTFTVSVTLTANALGVIFRSPDVNDGYMWQLNLAAGAGQGKIVFHTKKNGVYTVIKTVAYPSLAIGTAYAVQIVTSGSTFSFYIGGTLIDTETDPTFSQGVIGFRTGSTETATVDNVLVTTSTSVPDAPAQFQATTQWNAGNPLAELSWSQDTTGPATGFVLERRVTGTSTYQRLTGLNASATSFPDYWVQPSTSYDYRLSAFNASGSSGYALTTFPPAQALPLGYVNWAQALWPASGGALAAGSGWSDTAASGFANAFAYGFSGNPNVGSGAPGGLSVQSANPSSSLWQVWSNSFAARSDLHYRLQGSPDLLNWTTQLDETSPAFQTLGTGAGASSALLNVDASNASSPRFFRWSVSPNASAASAVTGMLVNGLMGTSGATLTQMTPAFSWEDGNDDTQSAYEILVATTPARLTESAADVWNSGEIAGSSSLNIPFAGLSLASNTTYYWTVKIWNSAGAPSAFSGVQSFTTGTLTATYATDKPKVIQESVAPVSFVQKGTGAYFVDFGQDAFGTVSVNIPAPVAGQKITVGMGEQLSAANTVNTSPTLYVRYQARTITLQSGVTQYVVTPTWTPLYSGYVTPPSYIGQVAPFRYVQLTNVPGTFTASQIVQLIAHTPFDNNAAAFTSSDPLLNSIWALCKQTTKDTTFTGYIVDGDRERTPYEADSYVGMLDEYTLNRDYATARANHEYLLTHSTWPAEWLFHSIFMAYQDYMYTGDSRSLSANYVALQGKLLPSHTRSDGLYTGTTISGSGAQPTDIVDWPATERDGYDMAMPVKTVTSAFRYQALVYMQQIATVLGKNSDASSYQTAATLTLNSLNSDFWDPVNLRYLDGMSSAGVVDAHSSIHANFFPLAFGMVPAANQANVVSYVESRITAGANGMIASPYGTQYLLEALYSAGEGNFALSLFDSTGLRSWSNMLATGTTLTEEAWDPSLKSDEDWNHVWGAAAANIIARRLMGIQPLTPGFGQVLIQPQPGTLTSASITVPTVRGPVSVNVLVNTPAEFSISVNLPANTTAKVVLPSSGSTNTTVRLDGVATTGTISGNTISLNNVPPGPHLFEYQP